MNYIQFYTKFKNLPIIDLNDVFTVFPGFDKRRINEWQKKQYIKKVASNFYIFTDRKIDENLLYIFANKIYSPSYVSLESAFSYYRLIPEAVFQITSITTMKRKSVMSDLDKTKAGFIYRQIKPELFFGYTAVTDNNFNASYNVAEPEKALLDYLYLRNKIKTEPQLQEMRLNKEIAYRVLTGQKIKDYLKIFNSKTLTIKIKQLIKICSR